MGILKKIFKKKDKNVVGNTKIFWEVPLEEFKNMLIMYYQQECALNDDSTYFEPQDTFFGEMLDNAIRIKLLIQENPQYEGLYDNEELKKIAKERYEEDKKKRDNENRGSTEGSECD